MNHFYGCCVKHRDSHYWDEDSSYNSSQANVLIRERLRKKLAWSVFVPVVCLYIRGVRWQRKVEQGGSRTMRALDCGLILLLVLLFCIFIWGNVVIWEAKRGDGCPAEQGTGAE
eukprot:gene39019-4971_t